MVMRQLLLEELQLRQPVAQPQRLKRQPQEAVVKQRPLEANQLRRQPQPQKQLQPPPQRQSRPRPQLSKLPPRRLPRPRPAATAGREPRTPTVTSPRQVEQRLQPPREAQHRLRRRLPRPAVEKQQPQLPLLAVRQLRHLLVAKLLQLPLLVVNRHRLLQPEAKRHPRLLEARLRQRRMKLLPQQPRKLLLPLRHLPQPSRRQHLLSRLRPRRLPRPRPAAIARSGMLAARTRMAMKPQPHPVERQRHPLQAEKQRQHPLVRQHPPRPQPRKPRRLRPQRQSRPRPQLSRLRPRLLPHPRPAATAGRGPRTPMVMRPPPHPVALLLLPLPKLQLPVVKQHRHLPEANQPRRQPQPLRQLQPPPQRQSRPRPRWNSRLQPLHRPNSLPAIRESKEFDSTMINHCQFAPQFTLSLFYKFSTPIILLIAFSSPRFFLVLSFPTLLDTKFILDNFGINRA